MAELPPTSETYSELQDAYDFFNARLFDNRLPSCLITLQRNKNTLGYFSASRFAKRKSGEKTDEIAMNPAYFSIRTIKASLSTLVHEMVHLYQQHFGNPGRGRYHNREWGYMMQERGLMPSDTGEEGGRRCGDRMSHYVIEGGPFDSACNELLSKEFTLSWVDRFPPYVPRPTRPINPLDDEDELEGEEDEPTTGPDLNDDLDGLDIENPPEPVNKSNRVKYRCSKCGAQVWGKPNLKIGCLDCNAQFRVV
ncbi:SprT-like domain-containing protein [Pseudodesulfovibrio senegalensis]|uniref:SprT family zinc-dependent metalloprotease n=1 Tax=Pseudodesulfovibrio senegalensis TaxID=1721087 RepID=A0A6N6MYM2_9BACT|nr:SprT-like domain-containing protein [Pseudodesulfovibrio senegalensis]KAB1437312.1 SprT family zinc-dependent metalloprotease [Pseudodesulfovibrio senegalensis]